MHRSMTYALLLYIMCVIILLQILGADIVFAKWSVFWLTPSVTPSRQMVSGFLCNRKKGLTAAGTAQVLHLIPIYQIAWNFLNSAAKV